jgi:phenylacetate-coenzyme A ligase PaaK-like adenylate-forming protein
MNQKDFPVFDVGDDLAFAKTALEIYHYQYKNNPIYNTYCKLLNRPVPKNLTEIPFLPISFFKNKKVLTDTGDIQQTFTSSGTTGSATSSHYVTDLNVYEQSLDSSFAITYGNHEDYVILALLPHYLERSGSSLVYMVQRWITKSKHADSGFYLHDVEQLAQVLKRLNSAGQKVILIGVTFALLDLASRFPMELNNTIIIETGGMKGMRKEIIKPELHALLSTAFKNASIQSEYGMTELLSQAYAANGIDFITPPWMRVIARDTNDPLSLLPHHKTGGLNIIDLANYNSCAFIATQDLGKTTDTNTFQVLGRFDHADVRGCNLMVV